MTQPIKSLIRPQRLILIAAVLIAAGAAGHVLWNRQDAAAPPATAMGAGAGAEPESSQGWQQQGLARFEAGDYAGAAQAYARAAELAPGSAVLWSALGEARVMASDRDPMPAEAVSAFEKAIAIDAADPRARYFLAVRRDLRGDHEGAIADWLALLADSPADAPWRADLMRTIQQVGKINGIDVAQRLTQAQTEAGAKAGAKNGARSPVTSLPLAAQGIPGPRPEDLAQAARIPPSEQTRMAQGMVSRLEQRLAGDPGNIEGWVMLMRSRITLNQPDKARKALADAVAANPAQAEFLRQQAALLGIR